jgi:hypothetical protein
MWEEDPKWQNATYRFLVASVIVLTVIVAAWSIVGKDWKFLFFWSSGLGIIIAALCVYAAIMWLIAHGVESVINLIRRLLRRH